MSNRAIFAWVFWPLWTAAVLVAVWSPRLSAALLSPIAISFGIWIERSDVAREFDDEARASSWGFKSASEARTRLVSRLVSGAFILVGIAFAVEAAVG